VDRHNKAIIANKDATTTTTTSTTSTTATTIPLTTLFLNDPWTNPAKIVSTYAEFSLAHGIITPADVDALGRNLTLFNAAMTAGRFDDATDIEHGMEHYIEAAGGGLNAYDIRRYAGYTYDALGKLLSSPSLKARLNVGNHSWQLSSDAVNSHLHADISRATDDLVGALLSSPAPNNYHVVIYNGNYDLDCNIAGTLKWLKDVRWPGAQAFANATVTAGSRRTWRLPPVKPGRNKAGDRNDNASAAAAAAVAGYCVEVDNLSQVVVLNAGHMVPLNQPRAAFMLLTNALKALNKPEGRVCTD
jgi:carboxypeptidase C (cathepsin A)